MTLCKNAFKDKFSIDERQRQTKVVLEKHYPYKVPVIIQKHHKEKSICTIEKNKFLVPMDMNYSQLMLVLRKRMLDKISPTIAIFLCTEDGKMLSNTELISSVYDKHHDKNDNFLYLFYLGENTFGSS